MSRRSSPSFAVGGIRGLWPAHIRLIESRRFTVGDNPKQVGEIDWDRVRWFGWDLGSGESQSVEGRVYMVGDQRPQRPSR